MAIDALRYVIQLHDARRLHYDVRLEADGVLVSWAVPKGPSLDPAVKRLAVHVDDHDLDHRHYEGIIDGARYGTGAVIIWDEGTYRNLTARDGQPVPVTDAVRDGHLSVWLDGVKLQGGWTFVRTGRGRPDTWIMVKRADERAERGTDITALAPASVRSGRRIDQLGPHPPGGPRGSTG